MRADLIYTPKCVKYIVLLLIRIVGIRPRAVITRCVGKNGIKVSQDNLIDLAFSLKFSVRTLFDLYNAVAQ